MKEQTSVPSRSGQLLMKLPGRANATLDAESLSSASLVEHLPCLGDGRINRSPHSSFLENGSRSRWSRSQRILAANLGTKLLAKGVQESCSITTSFREPISQHSLTVSIAWFSAVWQEELVPGTCCTIDLTLRLAR